MKLVSWMMVIWMVVVLGAFSYDALGDEVEFRVTDMTYKWGENYDFPVTAYHLGYARYYGLTGVRVMLGQSDTMTNTKGTDHTNQIRNFFVLNIHRKINLTNKVSIQYGLNYSEYKGGSKGQYNSDCDHGHGIAVQYRLSSDTSIKLSYDWYYEKYKEGLGLEETKGLGISLVGVL
jgi:outer membrane protein assembly factor BamA